MGETMGLFSSEPAERLEHAQFARARFVGAESNTAIGLARLGHPVRWLSVLGDDPLGRRILKTLRGEGVDVSGVSIAADAQTGMIVKDRRPDAEPAVYYYRTGSAFSRIVAGTFAPSRWRDARILYLTGITPALSDGCRAAWMMMLRDAASAGIPVWLDPNYRRKLWSIDEARGVLSPAMSMADLVLIGLSEGQALTGHDQPERIAAEMLKLGAKQVIVKAGADGAHGYSADGHAHAPAVPVKQIVDPIGAGDAFAAGVLSGVLDGLSITAAMARGNAAGAMVCMTDGDWEGLPTRAELDLVRLESQR
jgi:2-dehydro-3-deoxygluconokinase